MDSETPRIKKLGFFLLYMPQNGSYVGSLLVLDHEGIPLEFKCTEAIRPTGAQEVLYGQKMRSYIATKLCGIPLIKAVEHKPELLFVNDSDFLEIRKNIMTPTLFVERRANIDIDNVAEASFVLRSHPTYPDDRNKDEEMLQSLGMDLVEPFERIKTAVALLGKQDERFV